MAKMSRYSSLALVLLYLCNICFSEPAKGGFSVEIFHRDSPRSPFYRPTETQYQRVMNAVRRSINRVNYFNQRLASPDSFESTVVGNDGEYLMYYSIGTPPFELIGIVDTGSSLVWSQCQPCSNCFEQILPMFDPSKSTTYKIIPCSSITCQYLPRTSCSSGNPKTCEFTVDYGDKSHSHGDLSVDTITLNSTEGPSYNFLNTVIGCGHDNYGTFSPETSGIVGLGGGPASLMYQLGDWAHGKFSYCLVAMSVQLKYSSKLKFGDAAVVSGRGTVSTPLIAAYPREFYYVSLESFTVESRIAGRPTSTCSSNSGEPVNIIIDSGTTYTILPPDMYSKLESAVADEITLQRVISPRGSFNLCYLASPSELHAPLITAHFKGGAAVTLYPMHTFVQVDRRIVCLAFRSDKNYAIFGNLSQQDFLIGFDMKNGMVSIKPTDCTKA